MAVKIYVQKCSDYSQAKVAVGKLLDKLSPKLPEKGVVLLKPNLLMPALPERAITTHPAVVAGVCHWFRTHYPGAKLYIGDSSGCLGLAGTKLAFKTCGLVKLAEEYNAQLVPFESLPLIKNYNKHAKVWPKLSLPKLVVQADLIVNLPKLKTHSLTNYTGAVKNLYGCLPGGIKGEGHIVGANPHRFAELIVDVFEAVKPRVNIMDAVIGMEGAGPSNGQTKQTGYLLAGSDAVALDAVALKMAKIPESFVLTQTAAKERGLYPEYSIVGKFKPVKYKLPVRWKSMILSVLPSSIASAITSKMVQGFMKSPEIDYNKCTKCLTCVRICPAKAITTKAGLPVIHHDKCIKCLSCAEHCPEGAIHTKQNLADNLKRLFRGESDEETK